MELEVRTGSTTQVDAWDDLLRKHIVCCDQYMDSDRYLRNVYIHDCATTVLETPLREGCTHLAQNSNLHEPNQLKIFAIRYIYLPATMYICAVFCIFNISDLVGVFVSFCLSYGNPADSDEDAARDVLD